MKNQSSFSLIMLAVLVFAMYFLLIRPQRKRDKEQANMRSNLKKGDKIITIGGIIGTISAVNDDSVVILVGKDKVKLEFLKTAVGSVVNSKDSGDSPSKSTRSKAKKSEDSDADAEAVKVNRDKKITPKKLDSKKKPAAKKVEEVAEAVKEAVAEQEEK